jgi:hypothetical protein
MTQAVLSYQSHLKEGALCAYLKGTLPASCRLLQARPMVHRLLLSRLMAMLSVMEISVRGLVSSLLDPLPLTIVHLPMTLRDKARISG